MATAFPSYTNVFIPGFNGGMSERLIVDYGRDWRKNPVNMLASTSTESLPSGFFMRIKPEAQGRLIDWPAAFEFPDNTTVPRQEDHRRDFDYVPWNAKRYVYETTVGNMELEYASFDVEAQVTNDLGNLASQARSMAFYTTLNTAGNYLTGLTDTATNLGGGLWSAGTSANRYIEKTIQTLLQRMDQASMNGFTLDDLFLVVSPTVAAAMARSQEIADGLFRTTDYKEHLQYELFQGQLARYGLPPVLYGVTLVVDNWTKETTKIGATSSKSFLPDTNSAYLIAKPGGIKSVSGGKAFGSVNFFVPKGKEMIVNVIDVPRDHRKVIQCIDFFDCQLVAREKTALITNVLS